MYYLVGGQMIRVGSVVRETFRNRLYNADLTLVLGPPL